MTILEEKIKNYLIEEKIFKNTIDNPKLQFGFEFFFPPGKLIDGSNRGHVMAVFQPLGRNMLIVSIGTRISEEHTKLLGNKRQIYFTMLRKLFLMKDVLFRIDVARNRFDISEQIFIENPQNADKNTLFAAIRKIFNASEYSNIILGEVCYGKTQGSIESDAKDISSNIDFSLYS